MEKAKQEKETQTKTTSRVVWDCGSSLYDSFELKSFERKLDSAISSRTMSMPHLSDHRQPPPPAGRPQQKPSSKKPSRISRSLQKLLRSVFRPKQSNNSTSTDGVYFVYDTSGVLSTIPEVPENVADFDVFLPEMKSLVARTASDRFIPTSLGISCA